MRTRIALLTVFTLFTAHPGMAAEIPEFTRFVSETLTATDASVAACSLGANAPAERWFYRRFWLRVRSKVAFSVPGLAKVEIMPEVELLWQRDLPENWETYKL